MKCYLVLLGLLIMNIHNNYSQVKSKNSKPNIIVIMADDMGYGDTGFTGSTDILTPNLDNLANKGVVFKQGYANHPFCAPSRAAILSGRYPYRFGFETNPAYDPANPLMGIDKNEVLFPARLQKAGYKTGIIGKWHLGTTEDHHPLNRGFDYFYGFLGGGHDYFKIDETKPVWEAYLQGLSRDKRSANFEGYLTTALSRDAVDFVNENKENPFFLYLAYNAPHMPLQAPQEDIARYAHIKDKKRRVYAAMVDVMDRGIGEVLTALKKNNLYENTLVFFMSDNGGPQSSKSKPGKWNGSDNGEFRGGKGSLYDGGVHVPFIAHWPKGLPSGVSFDYPVNSLDISRTAVEVAGANATNGNEMEGKNLVPFVNSKKQKPPHEAIYWSGGNGRVWSVLNAKGMKHLVDPKTKKAELFNLKKDVSESKDILKGSSREAKELRSQWESWHKENIPGKMMGYKGYHKLRDKFYEESVPSVYKGKVKVIGANKKRK